jgi:choice-of-anchor A domain-containing protein
MTGPAGGIQGSVCIGPGGHLSMSGSQFITGNVVLSPGATISKSGSTTTGPVINNADLSAQISAAQTASANAAAMCSSFSGNLTNAQTITGNAGVNVLCVQNVNLSGGKVITLTGPAGASFVINVQGSFTLTGGSDIVVGGSLQPKDVLFNLIGSGSDVAFSGGGGGTNCCNAVVDGTILALNRKIALSPGLVRGEIISGRDISIVSGASVRCPCPQ